MMVILYGMVRGGQQMSLPPWLGSTAPPLEVVTPLRKSIKKWKKGVREERPENCWCTWWVKGLECYLYIDKEHVVVIAGDECVEVLPTPFSLEITTRSNQLRSDRVLFWGVLGERAQAPSWTQGEVAEMRQGKTPTAGAFDHVFVAYDVLTWNNRAIANQDDLQARLTVLSQTTGFNNIHPNPIKPRVDVPPFEVVSAAWFTHIQAPKIRRDIPPQILGMTMAGVLWCNPRAKSADINFYKEMLTQSE
jgi:hypothetical protein